MKIEPEQGDNQNPSTTAAQTSVVFEAIFGGLWVTKPVSEQPELTLVDWSVRELPEGDRHFVGYCLENREGRVSSAIQTMDLAAMLGVTATGRVYALQGRPRFHADADYVWRRWKSINQVETSVDVSKQLWAEHLRRVQGGSHGV